MKKFLKKLSVMAIISCLLIPTTITPAMAVTKNTEPQLIEGYTHYDETYVRKSSDSTLLEKTAQLERDNAVKIDKLGLVQPQVVDPGIGATRIIISGWSSGYTYGPDDEDYGTASFIWNNSLTILNWFNTTVGGVLVDVSQMLYDTVDKNKGATTRLFHSFYYPDKLVQVYTINGWTTYYTARPREWYRHEFASYVNTLNVTKTSTRNFTRDEGYSSFRLEPSPNYYNDTLLQDLAYERWIYGMAPGLETY